MLKQYHRYSYVFNRKKGDRLGIPMGLLQGKMPLRGIFFRISIKKIK